MPRRPMRRWAVVVAAVAAALALLAALMAFGPQLWNVLSRTERRSGSGSTRRGRSRPWPWQGSLRRRSWSRCCPGEPVELTAGYLFGFWEGTAVCLAGGLVGTLVATALTRALGMRLVRALFSEEQLEGVSSWLRDSRRFELVMFVVFRIPGTPKDVLTYVAGLTTCPWWRIAAIATVGRIPSIVTSTLAAGFASNGNWAAAGVTLAATVALVGIGAAAYALVRRRRDRAIAGGGARRPGPTTRCGYVHPPKKQYEKARLLPASLQAVLSHGHLRVYITEQMPPCPSRRIHSS